MRKLGLVCVWAGAALVSLATFVVPWDRYPLVGLPALGLMIVGLNLQLMYRE